MYTHEFTTDYLYTMEDSSTSFVRLANYIQETSLYHSNSIGYPMEWFYENQTGFLLISWNFEILNLPKWGDKINISTWPTKRRGRIANRSFIVKDNQGNTLVNADSSWIYYDIKNCETLKITDELMDEYGPIDLPLVENKIKIPKADKCLYLTSRTHLVRRFDIDSNHHVNNVNYIMWALNYIPDEIYKKHKLIKVSVKYSKESKINELLTIRTSKFTENEYLTEILNEDTEEVKCSIFTVWA